MTKRGNKVTRTLDDVYVTYHAIDAYVRRTPGCACSSARDALTGVAAKAHYAYTNATNEEVWRADSDGVALRLIIHRIARRPPILLTVMPWNEASSE